MVTSEVGPWAADKLERLGKYLHEYTKIMRTQSWCKGFYYIDAFAGPGSHSVRRRKSGRRGHPLLEVANYAQDEPQVSEFLDGSPRIALDIEYPFTGYVFVEKNHNRVAELEKLREEYKGRRRIVIRKADCNGYLLDKVVANSQINWKQNRAVVFLDPFGMQVPWSTLAALGGTKAIEVFLNFPVGMAIQRLIPRNPEKLTAQRRKRLDEYFGSEAWYEVVYRKRGATLLDIEEEEKVERSAIALVNWYRDRLRKAFGHASKAALIRNTRRGHLYYLLLASHNATGVKIANHILSAGEAV